MHKLTVQITKQLPVEIHIQNTVKHLRSIERFAKRVMAECWCATINFAGHWVGGGGTCKTRDISIKLLSKTQEKEVLQENNFKFYLVDTLKTTF